VKKVRNVFISKVVAGKKWLKKLIDLGANIDLIITLKDNKVSDGCNFLDISKKHEITLVKTNNINEKHVVNKLKKNDVDLIWVLGWSQIVKPEILDIPKIGCIGSHPTELPKYRGRAPIPWSIIKGLKESALTFFWLDSGVDNGDILIQKKFPIEINDTARDVYKKVISIGEDMLSEIYPKFLRGKFPRAQQNPDHFIEEWPKRTTKDSEIDWSKSELDIHNQIRAVAGIYPWAYTYLGGKKMLIKKSEFHNKKLIIKWAEFE